MAEFTEEFTQYVNTELPKRLSTEIDPASLVEGMVPISTGIGLGFRFVSSGSLVNVGLVTERDLPLATDGTVKLTQSPYGGLVLDTALIQLLDESYIEIIGVKVNGDVITFTPEDYQVIKDIAKSVTVTYLGKLEV